MERPAGHCRKALARRTGAAGHAKSIFGAQIILDLFTAIQKILCGIVGSCQGCPQTSKFSQAIREYLRRT
jgi:hypothetical protein